MKKTILLLNIIFLASLAVSCSSSKKVTVKNSYDNSRQLIARDHYLKGIFLQQESRYNEALVEFYQALQYDSSSAEIYNSIAENHMALSHYESAEILLHKSLKYDPENEEALQLVAECHLRLGRDDEAISIFRKILEINPTDEVARQYLFLLYEKHGDELAVAEQNEALLELYGTNPLIFQRLADIYLKNKKYDKAEFYLKELLATDSTKAQVYYLLGRVKDVQNMPEDAAEYYHKALLFDPLNQQAVDRLTYWHRSKKDWQQIIDIYLPFFQSDSGNQPARILIAESYYYLDQFDKARELLTPLASSDEAPVGVLELLGRIELEAKQPQQALTYFERIVRLDQKNKFAWLFLAFSYSDMDSLTSAENIYTQAVKELPDDAVLWSFYSLNLLDQQKYEQAAFSFEKALALEPDNQNALTNLPVVYENLKMFTKCDSLYEVALQRMPDSALLLNNFSYSLSERGLRLEEALEMSQKATAANPDNAAYLDTIGWIFYKLGKLNEAEQNIKKSVEVEPSNPVTLEHLGDVYFQLGETKQAKTYWQKALDLDQSNTELLTKIEKTK